MKRFLAVLFVTSWFLGSCTNLPRPSVAISPLQSTQVPTVSPAATVAGPTSSPASTQVAPATATQIAAVHTPSAPDKATITGILLQGSGAGSPVAGVILGLGTLVPAANGTPSFASYERTTSLKSETDSSGRFVFADVPVQMYVLIVDQVVQSYMLNDPQSGKSLIFAPKPGQVLDLGKLTYASLPGDESPRQP